MAPSSFQLNSVINCELKGLPTQTYVLLRTKVNETLFLCFKSNGRDIQFGARRLYAACKINLSLCEQIPVQHSRKTLATIAATVDVRARANIQHDPMAFSTSQIAVQI